MKDVVGGCPAERALQILGGRWKIFILNYLFRGTTRFAELQRLINNDTPATSRVTPKMLTQTLREMEADGLIHREVYPQVPPKVEYSLTPLGISMRPVFDAIADWGRQHKKDMQGAARLREEETLMNSLLQRQQNDLPRH